MLKIITVAAIATLAVVATSVSQPAMAGDNGGAIAAGVIGGLAAGAIIGSQVQSGPHYYGGPAYYQHSYQPVYRSCRTEREQYVDGYGRYRVRRIRVCD